MSAISFQQVVELIFVLRFACVIFGGDVVIVVTDKFRPEMTCTAVVLISDTGYSYFIYSSIDLSMRAFTDCSFWL